MNDFKLAAIILIVPTLVIMTLSVGPGVFAIITHAPVSTGICIFKGQPFYGYGLFGGTQSSGIPLREINVTAYDQYVEPFTFGYTDRTGCFIFQYPSGQQGFLYYQYNGTDYRDSITGGVVLQDNIP
jgi:hypothetical protein